MENKMIQESPTHSLSSSWPLLNVLILKINV